MLEDNAIDVLTNGIAEALKRQIEHLNYDKTFQSVVLEADSDGSYTILYVGQKYTVKNTMPFDVRPGQSVWVKIPGGDMNLMHICGRSFDENEVK